MCLSKQGGLSFPAWTCKLAGDPQSVLRILARLDALNEHIEAVAADLDDNKTFKKLNLRICTDLDKWNATAFTEATSRQVCGH